VYIISYVTPPLCRFAEWVEGNSPHVSDDEIRKHERNAAPPLPMDFTDDESDNDFSWT